MEEGQNSYISSCRDRKREADYLACENEHMCRRRIPLYIVEDHSDALPCVYRLIGSKRIPLENLTLLHFDSHSDLSVPPELNADQVFNKDELFSSTSIENWIIPMVYAGHVRTVAWIKPFWTQQSMTDNSTFYVGKHAQTGKIRVTSCDNYFLGELSYCPEESLTDCKRLSLHIVTLGDESLCDCGKTRHHSTSSAMLHGEDFDGSTVNAQPSTTLDTNSQLGTPGHVTEELILNGEVTCNGMEAEHYKLTSDSVASRLAGSHSCCTASTSVNSTYVGNQVASATDVAVVTCRLQELLPWNSPTNSFILDIDLDFFSTADPFRTMLTEQQHQLMAELYRYEPPSDISAESIQQCLLQRETQLTGLKIVFTAAQNGLPPELTDSPRDLLLQTLFHTIKQPESCSDLGKTSIALDPEFDYEWLHEIGTGIDDCPLPHHISSNTEIVRLTERVAATLRQLPRPAAITVARSSNDDYCRADQVDFIQQTVLEMLQSVYGELDVSLNYDFSEQS